MEEVVDKFQELLDSSAKKDNLADSLQKLKTIGEKIEGMEDNLVVPDRELAHEGAVEVLNEQAEKIADYTFLFSDVIIFVKSQKKSAAKKFLFVDQVFMHHVVKVVDLSPISFLIETLPTSLKKVRFTLTAASDSKKNDWFIDFQNVNRDFIRYRKVFGVPLKTLVKRDNNTLKIPQFVHITINFMRQFGLFFIFLFFYFTWLF